MHTHTRSHAAGDRRGPVDECCLGGTHNFARSVALTIGIAERASLHKGGLSIVFALDNALNVIRWPPYSPKRTSTSKPLVTGD